MKTQLKIFDKIINSRTGSDASTCIAGMCQFPVILVPFPGIHRLFSACIDLKILSISYRVSKDNQIVPVRKNEISTTVQKYLININKAIKETNIDGNILLLYKNFSPKTFSRYYDLYVSNDIIINSKDRLKAAFCGCHMCGLFQDMKTSNRKIVRLSREIDNSNQGLIKIKGNVSTKGIDTKEDTQGMMMVEIEERDKVLGCQVLIVFHPDHNCKNFADRPGYVKFFHHRKQSHTSFLSKQGNTYSQHSHCRYVPIKGANALYYCIMAHLKPMCALRFARSIDEKTIILSHSPSEHLFQPQTYLDLQRIYPTLFGTSLMRFFVYTGFFMRNAVVTKHLYKLIFSGRIWGSTISKHMIINVSSGLHDPFGDLLYLNDYYFIGGSAFIMDGRFFTARTSYTQFMKGATFPMILKRKKEAYTIKIHPIMQHIIDSPQWLDMSKKRTRARNFRKKRAYLYYYGYRHSEGAKDKFNPAYIKTVYSTRLWNDDVTFIMQNKKNPKVFKQMYKRRIDENARTLENRKKFMKNILPKKIEKVYKGKSKYGKQWQKMKADSIVRKARKKMRKAKVRGKLLKGHYDNLNGMSGEINTNDPYSTIITEKKSKVGYGVFQVSEAELREEKKSHEIKIRNKKKLIHKKLMSHDDVYAKLQQQVDLQSKTQYIDIAPKEMVKQFVNPFAKISDEMFPKSKIGPKVLTDEIKENIKMHIPNQRKMETDIKLSKRFIKHTNKQRRRRHFTKLERFIQTNEETGGDVIL